VGKSTVASQLAFTLASQVSRRRGGLVTDDAARGRRTNRASAEAQRRPAEQRSIPCQSRALPFPLVVSFTCFVIHLTSRARIRACRLGCWTLTSADRRCHACWGSQALKCTRAAAAGPPSTSPRSRPTARARSGLKACAHASTPRDSAQRANNGHASARAEPTGFLVLVRDRGAAFQILRLVLFLFHACIPRRLGIHQLSVMSVGFMLPNKDDAVIWRGPRKNGLIKQFLTDVDWGELDVLIVDTPPGSTESRVHVHTRLHTLVPRLFFPPFAHKSACAL